MEARQVAGEPVGGPAEGVIGVARRRAAVGAASVGGEERLEIAVGDERLDLVAVASRCRAGHRDGSSRSRATLRRARWMRTRTAPSERPRTPAISAVDISSTKRRISARRRSSGRRPTADQAAATSSFRAASSFDVDRAGHRAGRLERRFRAATQGAASLGDGVARDLEEPDPEGRGALAIGRACALLEPPEVRQGGEERALGGVLRLVMVAQLVEGVAVHLGQVLPIEGLESGRVRLGLLDEPSVTVEVDETRTTLLRTVHLPECRAGHRRYTRTVVGSVSRTWMTSPTRTCRSPVAVAGSATISAPVTGSTPVARTVSMPCAVSRRTCPAGRHLAGGPCGAVETPRPEGTDARLDVRLEHGQQVVSFDAAPSQLAERGHRGRDVLRKVGRGPVGIDAQTDDRARVVRSRDRSSRPARRRSCGPRRVRSRRASR